KALSTTRFLSCAISPFSPRTASGLIPSFSKSASIKSSHFVSFFSLVIFLYLKVITPHTNFLIPSATTPGCDHQAWQSAPAPLAGRIGLANQSLSAQLSRTTPVGRAARESQSLGRVPQESDRGPGPSTRR